MACLSLPDVMTKQLATSFTAFQIAWFRFALLALSVLPLGGSGAGTMQVGSASIAGRARVRAGGSAVLFLIGLRLMRIAEATAMVFASPLFVTLLAAQVLDERLTAQRWLPAWWDSSCTDRAAPGQTRLPRGGISAHLVHGMGDGSYCHSQAQRDRLRRHDDAVFGGHRTPALSDHPRLYHRSLQSRGAHVANNLGSRP